MYAVPQEGGCKWLRQVGLNKNIIAFMYFMYLLLFWLFY